jgi:hypothetical protein
MAVVDGAGVVSASYERLASVVQGLSENFEQLRDLCVTTAAAVLTQGSPACGGRIAADAGG